MTVYEWWTGTKTGIQTVYGVQYGGNTGTAAQTFTIGTVGNNEAFTLSTITLEGYRVGSPGTVNVNVFAVGANSEPTGATISNGSFNGNTITTSTDGEEISVTMTSVRLLKSIEYAIIVTAPTGTFIPNNYFAWIRGGTLEV